MSDRGEHSPAGGAPQEDEQPRSEHLNIKVTDNNNEVFFKIKRTTALSKLMNAFCERQGKALSSVRFLFDGARVNPQDSPDSVSCCSSASSCCLAALDSKYYLGLSSTLPLAFSLCASNPRALKGSKWLTQTFS